MQRTLDALILLGLLLASVACQGGPLEPTATAVPLAATATLPPRPTGIASAIPDSEAKSSPAADTPSPATDIPQPAATASGLLSDVSSRLAKRTVTGFLDRLVSGHAASAAALFLTDDAREGLPGAWLSQLAGSEARLAEAALFEFMWANETTYEARGELDWTRSMEGRAGRQPIELILTYQGGLWLVDEMTLEPIGTGTPIPAP